MKEKDNHTCEACGEPIAEDAHWCHECSCPNFMLDRMTPRFDCECEGLYYHPKCCPECNERKGLIS